MIEPIKLTPNKERLRLWVAALRSGEYPQTQGRLCLVTEDGPAGWCCLGVECDVALDHDKGLVDAVVVEDPHSGTASRSYNGDTGLPPMSVAGWYGINSNPEVGTVADLDDIERARYCEENDLRESNLSEAVLATAILATYANDGLNWSFDKIADAVEKHYGLKDDDEHLEVLR